MPAAGLCVRSVDDELLRWSVDDGTFVARSPVVAAPTPGRGLVDDVAEKARRLAATDGEWKRDDEVGVDVEFDVDDEVDRGDTAGVSDAVRGVRRVA